MIIDLQKLLTALDFKDSQSLVAIHRELDVARTLVAHRIKQRQTEEYEAKVAERRAKR